MITKLFDICLDLVSKDMSRPTTRNYPVYKYNVPSKSEIGRRVCSGNPIYEEIE